MIAQSRRQLAVAVVILTLPLAISPITAGTLCRGVYIAGLQDAAERGKAVVGEPTHDTSKMRIYAEKVATGWYYQTNVVIDSAPFPAKIISAEPLSLRVVVANMLRRPAATAMTRPVVVADASLFEIDAPVQFASAE